MIKSIFFLIGCSIFLASCASTQKKEERAALYLQIGNDYLEQRDYPSALNNLIEADRLAPNNPMILNSLGMLYFYREKYDTALDYLKRAIQASPTYTDARANYARVLIALAQYNSAIQQLGIVLKDLTYAQLDKAYTNLGLAYLRKDNYNKAKNYFSKAIASNQHYCPAYGFYGQTLLKAKEYQTASGVFDQALRTCETDLDELNYYSALANYNLKKIPQARARLQEIINSNPAGRYAEKAQKLLSLLEQDKK